MTQDVLAEALAAFRCNPGHQSKRGGACDACLRLAHQWLVTNDALAEYARLLGVEDIARLIVSGWDHGFPVGDGDGERELIDRLRAALAPSAEPPETEP